ncbi:MAG: lysine--tRNA ligase [Patescibacteria group bacterium]|nr:lysine--tRNA ligase [Patescibacteria group bacterium]
MADNIREARLKKLQEIRDNNENPYPTRFARTHSCEKAGKLPESTKDVSVAGRMMFERAFGKLAFWKLRDQSGDFQIVLRADAIGEDRFKFLIKNIDVGDILGISGEIIKTKTGEISLLAKTVTVLSKSIRPLPEKWHGIKDEDELYRRRYLDFLLNPESREKVLMINKIANVTREFMVENGFVEVQTPILENTASGAAAMPFKTHINAFDEDIYLRVCIGELWQKKMMVGAFEKTFEIGKAFRNEGVDRDHNPEFTMCEYYMAYADRDDQLEFFEKLFLYIIDKVKGTRKVPHGDLVLDFTPPFRRITFRDLVLEKTGIDINLAKGNLANLQKIIKNNLKSGVKLDVSKIKDYMVLLDELWKRTTRPFVFEPTFVLDYPIEMKPLSKLSPDDPSKAHVFQLLVDGAEMCNAYSELNDPLEQAERFAAQKKLHNQNEAFTSDDEFVEALEYGMPPATGLGFGLDRLAMILTDAKTVREVNSFPFMKKGKKGSGK